MRSRGRLGLANPLGHQDGTFGPPLRFALDGGRDVDAGLALAALDEANHRLVDADALRDLGLRLTQRCTPGPEAFCADHDPHNTFVSLQRQDIRIVGRTDGCIDPRGVDQCST